MSEGFLIHKARGITCCKDCVPPKRHKACHDTCPEYLTEKILLEIDKGNAREYDRAHPILSNHDFEKVRITAPRKPTKKRRRCR